MRDWPDVERALHDAGFEIEEASLKEPSLEDVFFDHVGSAE
jgi:hypothetical protein